MQYLKSRMTYYIRQIILAAVIFLLFGTLAVVFAFAAGGLSGVILFGLFALLAVLYLVLSALELSKASKNYKQSLKDALLPKLTGMRDLGNRQSLWEDYRKQAPSPLFVDDRVTITQDFLVDTKEDRLFLINGILDVQTNIHRVNGLMDKIGVTILYCDGQAYSFTQRRHVGANVDKQQKAYVQMGDLLSGKSENFRKIPYARLD